MRKIVQKCEKPITVLNNCDEPDQWEVGQALCLRDFSSGSTSPAGWLLKSMQMALQRRYIQSLAEYSLISVIRYRICLYNTYYVKV